MFNQKKIGVIITAGGFGKRMGSQIPKQFISIGGKPIILYSLELFQIMTSIDIIVVVAFAEKMDLVENLVQSYSITKVKSIVPGGFVRQDSVWNGLKTIQQFNPDVILIHDAVRPFCNKKLVENVISSAIEVGAVIPAVQATDTIKKSNNDRIVHETLNRDNIWLVQTPQGFKSNIIIEAFKIAYQNNFYGTDDASLVEKIGYPVKIIEGDVNNIKITSPEDLALGEFLLEHYHDKTTI